MRLLLLIALTALVPWRTAEAQRLPAPALPVPAASPSLPTLEARASTPLPVLAVAGVLGGAAGLAGGFYSVNAVCPIDDQLYCQVAALVTATAAESALLPLGVHLANGRRGSYPRALLSSAALGALGLALVAATDAEPPVSRAVVVGIPVAQLVTSIVIERRTAR